MKFSVEFERGRFGKKLVGFQLIEAESIGAAFEKVMRDVTAGLILDDRWKVRFIQQVADNAKPEEFRFMTLAQKELELKERAFQFSTTEGEKKSE